MLMSALHMFSVSDRRNDFRLRQKIILAPVQPVVRSLLFHKLRMASRLYDALMVDIKNTVCIPDRGEAVRDDKLGPSLNHRLDALLNHPLRLRIDARSRLIQNQDARIGYDRPCKGQQLPLSD